MPLTNQQIDQLFAFTRKKYVHYYDLQVELADHLASSIEEEMEKDTSLSFDIALQKVYSRFGIFGFAKVVQERESTLVKHNRKIWWNIFKSFFTIPRIAFTIAFYFATLLIAQVVPGEVTNILFIAGWLVFTIISGRMLRRIQKQTIKPLLLTQYATGFFFPGVLFPYFLINIDWSRINAFLFAGFLTLVVIYELAVIKMNQQLQAKAKSLYPEAFATAS